MEGWGSFTSILCKTLTEMQNTDGRQSYRPSELLNSFKKKTMQCMDGGQHDSHELLRHLLEIVRNEDLRVSILILFNFIFYSIFSFIIYMYINIYISLYFYKYYLFIFNM